MGTPQAQSSCPPPHAQLPSSAPAARARACAMRNARGGAVGRAWADPTLPPWVATMCFLAHPNHIAAPPESAAQVAKERHRSTRRRRSRGSMRQRSMRQALRAAEPSWRKNARQLVQTPQWFASSAWLPRCPPTPTAQQRCTARMHVLARRRSIFPTRRDGGAPLRSRSTHKFASCRAPCAQPNMASMTIHFDSKHPKEDWTVWCARPPCSINPNNTCMRSAPPHRRERRPLHRL